MSKVYIVDDSKAIRERLKEILVDIDGVEIIGESEDPTEALVEIRANRPEVVILDIHLPGISGIEALKALRSDTQTQKIPVAALTVDEKPDVGSRPAHARSREPLNIRREYVCSGKNQNSAG